ncbi:hypothetical protein ACFL34_02725 [Candidatus Sumerlaeota bacterium]
MRTFTTAVTMLALTLGFTALAKNEKPQTFTEILAARPAPKLEGLAERAKPGITDYKITGESFHDLLKVRNMAGPPEAVPELAKIMESHVGNNRIHGYAAAQALFCIDTPETHQLLEKYVFAPSYRAGKAINYTAHWEMSPAQASALIKRYYLKNLAKDLTLKLEGPPAPEGKVNPLLEFTLTLRNTSDKAYRLRQKQVYLGTMLYFENASGRIFTPRETVRYDMPMSKWLVLEPGATHQYKIATRAVRVSGMKHRPYVAAPGDEIVLRTQDIGWGVAQEGQFKVHALVEAQPLLAEARKRLGFDNCWVGRAVSQPVEVMIANAMQPPKPKNKIAAPSNEELAKARALEKAQALAKARQAQELHDRDLRAKQAAIAKQKAARDAAMTKEAAAQAAQAQRAARDAEMAE